ncbi:protein pxr1-like [Limosa lapponica baueri]|uniref:Protein pxr1-like n=1 Tax=Limosa lapponica baueri TaxID=1758121 RepID=A0A2I0U660_LIMLA|nr:protein pxr1-like [Limosa lapponica baueri]
MRAEPCPRSSAEPKGRLHRVKELLGAKAGHAMLWCQIALEASEVVCTPKEFKDYRQYLTRLKLQAEQVSRQEECLGSSRTAGVASVRRHQKLSPCWLETVAASFEMDLPLAKAEPSSNVGSASGITCEKGSKLLCNSSWERGVRICERNNSADTTVSEEGRGRGLPGGGAQIPPQRVVKTMVTQVAVL